MAKKTRRTGRSRPVGRKAGKKKGSVRRRLGERRGKSTNVSSRRRTAAKTRAARTAKRRGGVKTTAGPARAEAAKKKSGAARKATAPAKGSPRARTKPAASAKAGATAKRGSTSRSARPTGTAKPPAPRAGQKRPPALDRERKRLDEVAEAPVPSPPSSLDMDRSASAARSGQREMQQHIKQHKESGPALTGGDVDATWETAYSTGDEAPGGDNPTPDQDRVDDIGKSLGVQYEDNEELKASDKITERDRHRWELDPASSEDYKDRTKR